MSIVLLEAAPATGRRKRRRSAQRQRLYSRWIRLLERANALKDESLRLRILHGDMRHPAILALEDLREDLARQWYRLDFRIADDELFILRRCYLRNPAAMTALLQKIVKGETA